MEKLICVHGHFYQPPRENPWLEEIELQDSAYPYHDWNRRITAECYEPNAASRILGPDASIINIINNYSNISFNFGPTLLLDLEKANPEVYGAILEADRLSMEKFSGHGSAIAQIYNHMIMPLANRRDKYTQVIWGIKDFESRFKRRPEGMWLPETAADAETLDILAEHGIKFTILSPRQAKRIKRPGKSTKWQELSGKPVETARPYICQLPSGRSIAVFFYNGDISHEVGFGGLLFNGEAFAKKLVEAYPEGLDSQGLVHTATDGETFGHHHKHGEMALSYCLYFIESQKLGRLTNYAEFLSKHQPEYLAEIHENSSWSCVHGVERWRSDCGCNSGTHQGWTQAWRAPLKEAIDWLRDHIAPVYAEEAGKLVKDPWAARNDYIDVILDRTPESIDAFMMKHQVKDLSPAEKVKVIKFLEVQRNAMLMYTSCGWFFDEVSGIETVQVMMYASRAIQLLGDLTGANVENGFMEILERAPSNVLKNGREAYDLYAKPARLDLPRVGAHLSISSLFRDYTESGKIFCYAASIESYQKSVSGKFKLATGTAKITSRITQEEAWLGFSAFHLGETNITGGVTTLNNGDKFHKAAEEIKIAFDRGDITETIRLMDKNFESHYSLLHIFKDEQRKIINQILLKTYENIEDSYRHIFDDNYNLMEFLNRIYMPLPKPLSVAAEYIINTDLKETLIGSLEFEKLEELIKKAKSLSVQIDSETIGFVASEWINSSMERMNGWPEDIQLLESIRAVLKLLSPTPLKMNLFKAQNVYFFIGKAFYGTMVERAKKSDPVASRWIEAFNEIGGYVGVKVP